MNLNGKEINNVVVVGENNTKTATINPEKMAKLQYLLTNGLYQDGISATIVEITNNALDSIIQAGKDPMKNPVYVYIEKNPSTGKNQLRIVDNGLGLDEEEFENVVMNYLTSTKETDDDVIGAFGIGAKSWCSISNNATFICRKNGVERNFLCYKGPQFLKYDKVYEKETTEENGVTFILPIKDDKSYWENEKGKFVIRAKQRLCYYDNVILTVDGDIVDNKIYRHELFQWSTLNTNSELHFALKDVYYPINFEALGIERISIPICLRFGLKDGIMPTPSRENIIYTDTTINLIKERIIKVAEFFKDKYNQEIESYKDILTGWYNIESDEKIVKLEGRDFMINSLLDYAKLEVEEVKVDGINLRSPGFYKKNFDHMMYEYSLVAYKKDGWKKKLHYTIDHRFLANDSYKKLILLKNTPVGTFKTFLGDKYYNAAFFAAKNIRGLWRNNGYYKILGLDKVPKEKWRDYIKEWQYVQKTVIDTFENQTSLEDSDEFKEWLEERKREQKENRAKGIYSSNYIALNKQKGEITCSVARHQKWQRDITFNKGTVPIQHLHKMGAVDSEGEGYLSIYFTKDEVAKNRDFIYKAIQAFPRVKFVLVNEREVKFVKDLKNWKTKSQFMFSKPLKRYVTASAIKEYLALVPKNEDLIYEAFPKYGQLKSELSDYVNKNHTKGSNELYEELKKVAEEQNLWDMEVYHLLVEFKQVMKNFGFLNYLKAPDDRNTTPAERKVIRNLIYSILKLKKIDSNFLTEYELVRKEPMKAFKVEIGEDENDTITLYFDNEESAKERFKNERRNGYVSYSKANEETGEYDEIESFNPRYDDIEDEYWDFWRPELNDQTGEIECHNGVKIADNAVWKSLDKLIEDYEDCIPIGYKEGDIVNPVFMDIKNEPEEEEEEEEKLPFNDEDDVIERNRDLTGNAGGIQDEVTIPVSNEMDELSFEREEQEKETQEYVNQQYDL